MSEQRLKKGSQGCRFGMPGDLRRCFVLMTSEVQDPRETFVFAVNSVTGLHNTGLYH